LAKPFWQRKQPQPLPRVLALTTSPIPIHGQWDVLNVQSFPEALRLLAAERVPIVLFDRDLPNTDWRAILTAMAKSSPDTCILLTSRVCDDYLWKEVVRCGGYDVIPKPLTELTVEHTLQKAWAYWSAKQ
jgi:DNA-binding NtrC family response regulator